MHKVMISTNVVVAMLFVFMSAEGLSFTNNTIYVPDDNGFPVLARIKCTPTLRAHIDLPKQVRFFLFRRYGNNKEINTQMKIGKPLPIDFLKKGKTKILIHGFINTLKSEMIQETKQAYLSSASGAETNVIGVDWGDLATLSTCYVGAKSNTKLVGPYITKFINYLQRRGALDLDKLHLIGHSLGAHVAGIAGAGVKKGQVARITGLDPAGVLYDSQSSMLDRSDARFVDVIHTDTQILGYKPPCGHADFYPYGGGHQPGCYFPGRSHSRAHLYFRESVQVHDRYPARQCDSLTTVTSCTVGGICTGCQHDASEFMGEFANLTTYGCETWTTSNWKRKA